MWESWQIFGVVALGVVLLRFVWVARFPRRPRPPKPPQSEFEPASSTDTERDPADADDGSGTWFYIDIEPLPEQSGRESVIDVPEDPER